MPTTPVATAPDIETPKVTNKGIIYPTDAPTPELEIVTILPVMATDAPTTDAPIPDAPITDAAITDAPTPDAPVTDAPTTDAPTPAGPKEPTSTPDLVTLPPVRYSLGGE